MRSLVKPGPLKRKDVCVYRAFTHAGQQVPARQLGKQTKEPRVTDGAVIHRTKVVRRAQVPAEGQMVVVLQRGRRRGQCCLVFVRERHVLLL
jgi:hypothetical protein